MDKKPRKSTVTYISSVGIKEETAMSIDIVLLFFQKAKKLGATHVTLDISSYEDVMHHLCNTQVIIRTTQVIVEPDDDYKKRIAIEEAEEEKESKRIEAIRAEVLERSERAQLKALKAKYEND